MPEVVEDPTTGLTIAELKAYVESNILRLAEALPGRSVNDARQVLEKAVSSAKAEAAHVKSEARRLAAEAVAAAGAV